MVRPKTWLKLRINGQDCTVRLVDSAIVDGDECHGVYYPESGRIEIARVSDNGRHESTLLHEIMHACMSGISATNTKTKVFRCKREEVDELEESIISYLAPLLYAALKDNRLLRVPKPRK